MIRVYDFITPMKSTKRKRWLALLALVSMALPSAAFEQRAFYSKDKTQTFSGCLTDYDATKKSVTVKLKNGQKKRFNLNFLSEDDQKYVLGHQDTLAVGKGLSVSFKKMRDKSTRTKEGLIRTSVIPTYYDVTIYNRTKTEIDDLELRYSYYYCIGTLAPKGPKHTPHIARGMLSCGKIYGQDTLTLQTAKIDIIRASKKGVAPPVSGGRGGGGG